VRGNLSDIVIQPAGFQRADRSPLPATAGPLLTRIRQDERVAACTARLSFYGILSLAGADARDSGSIISSTQHGELMAVQLMGVDVLTREREALGDAAAGLAALGFPVEPAPLQDEFDATDFRASLEREPFRGMPVADPRTPFDPPADPAEGLELASVIIGEQLAHYLRIVRGQRIRITTGTPDPVTGEFRPSNRDFVVAGTFRSGENETDINRIYFPRSELHDFVGLERDFSEVLVKLHDYERDGEAVAKELRTALDEAGLIRGGTYAFTEVRTWEEFRGTLLGAIENERVLMAIMLSLVLVVAGFTVFAILSMMVTEKQRDIGILTAMGATPRGILGLFLMIAFWDALLGVTLGAIMGTWAAIKIDAIELWLSRTFDVQIFDRSVYYFDHIPSVVHPVAVAAIVVGAFLITLLFAAIPAWRASRMDPVEALRYE
jgi:ABC-type lipoprotein release transport system permease subunit